MPDPVVMRQQWTKAPVLSLVAVNGMNEHKIDAGMKDTLPGEGRDGSVPTRASSQSANDTYQVR